nr:hypothetical protein [uncultured Lichenicoccus sp.]
MRDIPYRIPAASPVRAGQFPKDGGRQPWLDRPDAVKRVARRVASGEITRQQGNLCLKWIKDGYLILDGFLSANQLDLAWAASPSLRAS